MLSASSPPYLHVLQNLVLVYTSLIFLPLSTLILFISYALHPQLLFRYNTPLLERERPAIRPAKSSQQLNGNGQLTKMVRFDDDTRPTSPDARHTVLVTGVGMTKGLHIARAFHLSHHRVIGADSSLYNLIPPAGRFSRAIDKFYALPLPNDGKDEDQYIKTLVEIVKQEKISLWISCSDVASALDDARAKEIISLRSPSCTCIQFDVSTTSLLHEKDTFTAHAASLGLPIPETHTVTTRAAVHKVLHESPRTKKRYVMKSLTMDDASRAEISTLLPRRTLSETYNHLARMPISQSNPWVLQQYIPGNREYCTHALVIQGKVKAFVACPSSELLMHYCALPHPDSALSRAMLRFTEEFAQRCQSDRSMSKSDFTGHLSFDFLVEEQVTARGVENVLRAIECNPRAHTAVALFRGKQTRSEMVQAYLDALKPQTAGENEKLPVTLNGSSHDHPPSPLANISEEPEPSIIVHPSPTNSPPIYWLAHDIITLLLHPILRLLLHPLQFDNTTAALVSVREFLTHLLYFHDGAYETWDPLPAFVLYHLYWPGVFVGSLVTGGRWSRVNVSTGKVFGC